MTSSEVSLPKGGGGVGGIGGSFAPDLNTGGGGYSVPIDVPEGRNGTTPSLTLKYSTAFGSGPFGLGWDLGLIRIDRDVSREVLGEGDEALVAPGVGPLLASSSEPGRYVPETDGLVWTIRRLDDGFEIVERNGRRHRLGTAPASRIADPAHPERIVAWLVDQSVDPDGERIEYTYLEDGAQRLPSSVSWAQYRVVFDYEERPDPILDGRPGLLLSTTQRCRSVRLEVEGEAIPVVRRWRLGYTQAEHSRHSLLSSISIEGVDGDGAVTALPPTELEYRSAVPEQVQLEALPHHVATGLLNGAQLTDFTGDGLPDLFEVGEGRLAVGRNRGELGFDRVQRVDRRGVPGLSMPTVFAADVTGRGRVDLLAADGDFSHRFPIEGDGELGRPHVWKERPAQDLAEEQVRVADLRGDGALELFSLQDGVLTVDEMRDAGWRTERSRVETQDLRQLDTSSQEVFIGSLKGDGLSDLVQIRSGEVRWWPALGGGRWAASRTMTGSPVLPSGYRPDRVFLVDVDGDGCADVVYLDDREVRVWINRGGIGFSEERVIPFVPGAIAERVEFVDLVGFGAAGLVLAARRSGREMAWYLSLRELGGSRLASVQGGLGDRLEIAYESSVQAAARDRRQGQSWSTFLPLPVTVVSEVRRRRHARDTEHVTRYRYHEGSWDPALRRFLGFGRVETLEEGDDSAKGMRTVSEFHAGRPPARVGEEADALEARQSQALRGRLIRSAVTELGEAPSLNPELLVVEQEWVAELVDVAGVQSARPRLTERRELHLDGELEPWRTTTTTTLAWDEWENPLEERQQDVLAADPTEGQTLRTNTTYASSPGSLVRDRPSRVVQTDGEGRVVGLRILRYDGAGEGLAEGQISEGRVTSEERLVVADEQAAEVFGQDLPDFEALGLHRRPDVEGWMVWSARYSRAGLEGPGPAVLTSIGPLGASQTATFDAERLYPERIVDARGNVTTVDRDPRSARVARLVDANGEVRRNEYDGLGRLVREFRPGDPDEDPAVRVRPEAAALTPFVERTMSHEPGSTADIVQRDLFDAEGHRLVRASRDGDSRWVISEATELNWRGAASRRYMPYSTQAGAELDLPASDRAHESITYDALGRMLRTQHADGSSRRAEYGAGRSVLFDEEDLRTGGRHENSPTVFELDGSGRVRRVRSTRGDEETVTSYRYDLRNNPVEIVDALGRATRIDYDLEGRRLRVRDPDAGTTTFLYDAAGNLVERRNGLGQRVVNEYDELNRLRRARQPDTEESDVRYDYVDQIDEEAGADLSGLLGRLVRVVDSLGVTSLSYDSQGELSQKRIELAGTDQVFVLGRSVDRLGRVRSVTYPALGETAVPPQLSYQYDPVGRLVAIDGVIDSVQYNSAGDSEQIRHANGVTTVVAHDVRGRATRSTVSGPGDSLLEDWELTLDLAGNVVRIDDHREAGKSWSYEHDEMYQLSRAVRSDGSVDLEFRYDEAGNVTFRTDRGELVYGEDGASSGWLTSAGATTYQYDSIGRQTSGADGAVTYDAMNRMTAIVGDEVRVEQRYGAFGEPTIRRSITSQGTSTSLRLDASVEVHAGRIVCFVLDGDRRIAQFSPGQSVEHLHADHRGSTTLVTGAGAAVLQRLSYDPFGRVLSVETQDGFVDVGRRADGYESLAGFGLQFASGRLYDPALGRFTTPDPVISDLWHPIALNRYAYVGNNPVTWRDPSGRAWWHVVVAAIAVVAVVVLTVVTFGVGLISLGAMIGVFAAMAAGAAVGGIAAAQAGGGLEEVLLGIFVGAALSGAAALGGALIGVGFGAAFGTSSFLTHVLGGAASGLLLGAATGFASGFAGGMGSAGDIWRKTWQSALIGMAVGAAFGLATYGFQQGWFGTGKIAVHSSKEPLDKAAQKAAAEAAKSLGESANQGAIGGAEVASAAAAGGKSFASNFFTFGGNSGFPLLEVLVFNPVAQNLLIVGGTSLFSLDLIDDLINLLQEEEVSVPEISGEF